MWRAVIVSVLCLFFISGIPASAQELHQDVEEVVKAEVVAILSEESRQIANTDAYSTVQMIQVRFLSGSRTGKIFEFENDRLELAPSQKIYVNHLVFIDGTELFSVRGVDRTTGIFFMFALFAGTVLLFGRMQGLRSLMSLAGSFLLIFFVLFPLFLAGYSPIAVSIVLGSVILCSAIILTHGASTRSLVACAGATLSIVVTALIAIFGTDLLHLSGFFSDEAVYLNLNTAGALDFRGLLLGSIIIGVLGVLDDIAVTQVAVVAELKEAVPGAGSRELYARGLRVGREHVSALVNTIVLAYAGVSLPLLLLFSGSGSSFIDILNNEIFATEIVRTIAGSIGLIATVPITTGLAVFFVSRFKPSAQALIHTHSHSAQS